MTPMFHNLPNKYYYGLLSEYCLLGKFCFEFRVTNFLWGKAFGDNSLHVNLLTK